MFFDVMSYLYHPDRTRVWCLVSGDNLYDNGSDTDDVDGPGAGSGSDSSDFGYMAGDGDQPILPSSAAPYTLTSLVRGHYPPPHLCFHPALMMMRVGSWIAKRWGASVCR